VMFILARGGRSYARLRFGVGPAAAVEIPVEMDYRQPFRGSDESAWELEHHANVRPRELVIGMASEVDMLDELAWREGLDSGTADDRFVERAGRGDREGGGF